MVFEPTNEITIIQCLVLIYGKTQGLDSTQKIP